MTQGAGEQPRLTERSVVDKALEGLADEGNEAGDRVPVKFLLSQVAAGVVIGRAGSSVSQIQNISGTKIQLSRTNEFYPDTTDRILLVHGGIRSIVMALHLMLQRLTGQQETELRVQMSYENSELKMIMPARVCGAIIGSKGETVRRFTQESGAGISVTPISQAAEKPLERIVTITGVVDQVLRAVALIVHKVAEDPYYRNHPAISRAYPPPFGVPMMPSSSTPLLTTMPTYHQQLHMQMMPHGIGLSQPMPGPVMATMQVPDDRVGVIIGKGGESIKQIQSLMGVRVVISGRDEFEPGTRNRRVDIFGPPDAVQLAHMLLQQKLAQGPSHLAMQPRPPGLI